MAQQFALKIVSPTKLVFDAKATMAEIPGREGDFGVLKDHAPFVSVLRPGVVTVHLGNTGKKRYFLTSGYAEVSEDETVILSDHIQEVDYISVEEARGALKAAEAAHQAADGIKARMKARRRLEAAQALVEALRVAGR